MKKILLLVAVAITGNTLASTAEFINFSHEIEADSPADLATQEHHRAMLEFLECMEKEKNLNHNIAILKASNSQHKEMILAKAYRAQAMLHQKCNNQPRHDEPRNGKEFIAQTFARELAKALQN